MLPLLSPTLPPTLFTSPPPPPPSSRPPRPPSPPSEKMGNVRIDDGNVVKTSYKPPREFPIDLTFELPQSMYTCMNKIAREIQHQRSKVMVSASRAQGNANSVERETLSHKQHWVGLKPV